MLLGSLIEGDVLAALNREHGLSLATALADALKGADETTPWLVGEDAQGARTRVRRLGRDALTPRSCPQ